MIHKIRNIIIFYSLGGRFKRSVYYFPIFISINFLFIWRQRQSPHYHQTPKMAKVTLLTESEKNIYYQAGLMQPVGKYNQLILMNYIWMVLLCLSSVGWQQCAGANLWSGFWNNLKCSIIKTFCKLVVREAWN